MARRYRPGDVKWVAYPHGVERVEIVARGTGGLVFKNGQKPENPYVVSESECGDEYVLGEEDLFDDPIQASVQVAKLRKEHDIEDNPLDDDEDESNEDEDWEEFDGEEDEEFEDEDDEG